MANADKWPCCAVARLAFSQLDHMLGGMRALSAAGPSVSPTHQCPCLQWKIDTSHCQSALNEVQGVGTQHGDLFCTYWLLHLISDTGNCIKQHVSADQGSSRVNLHWSSSGFARGTLRAYASAGVMLPLVHVGGHAECMLPPSQE